MRLKNKDRGYNHLYIPIISILLIIGIYRGWGIPIICLLILLFRLIKSNKDTVGVFLLLFGGLLGGIIREIFPILPMYGLVLMALGGFLLRRYFIILVKDKTSVFLVMMILCILLFSYLYGPMSEFATTKYLYIVLFGLMKFFAFYCICKSTNISNNNIGEMLILLSILSISVCLYIYDYPAPTNIIDFEWIRQGYNIYQQNHGKEPPIVYHIIGLNALYALAFFITNKKTNALYKILTVFVCILVTLISGARQSILGVLVLFIAYFLIFKGKNISTKIKNIVVGLVVVIAVIYIFSSLDSTAVTNLFDSSQGSIYEQSNRNLNFITAISLINENPWFGTGLGGYQATGIGPYPHNFILEILCECGIFGMFMILLILYLKHTTSHIKIRYQTANGSFYFLIILCLIIRSSVSGDLTESIGIFMSILAIPQKL